MGDIWSSAKWVDGRKRKVDKDENNERMVIRKE